VRAEWIGHAAWILEGKDKVAIESTLGRNRGEGKFPAESWPPGAIP